MSGTAPEQHRVASRVGSCSPTRGCGWCGAAIEQLDEGDKHVLLRRGLAVTSGAPDPRDVRAGTVLLENFERTGRLGGPATLEFSDETLEVAYDLAREVNHPVGLWVILVLLGIARAGRRHAR